MICDHGGDCCTHITSLSHPNLKKNPYCVVVVRCWSCMHWACSVAQLQICQLMCMNIFSIQFLNDDDCVLFKNMSYLLSDDVDCVSNFVSLHIAFIIILVQLQLFMKSCQC